MSKNSSKLQSLSVNCQKSKEPCQWKVSVGEVFIPETSRNRTELGNERSSSYGTREMTTMTCEQHKPAKEKASQRAVTADLQLSHLENTYKHTLKGCTFFLYCCLKKRALFNTLKLLNNLSSYLFVLNEIMYKCIKSFTTIQPKMSTIQ